MWFKKHLNWTLVMGVFLVEIPLLFLFLSGNIDEITPVFFYSILSVIFIFELVIEVWYLYQKKRSYAYLLLNFLKPYYIPVGFLLLLSLSNNRIKSNVPEVIPN